MFSDCQDIVEKLLVEDQEFKSMYDRHRELNKEVDKADIGVLAMSDDTLHIKKKEKLHLKDCMAETIRRYQQGAG
ncbi:MAG: YdcH family protein [Gammaproteobacteria bacterium]|nr:YdcH family protein [Gammaproteobacteria bacterium]